ncbi:MAG TPA: DUF5666 domain-containing protein [Acidobacteriaceae bacterium]|jgi:hypothetical protein
MKRILLIVLAVVLSATAAWAHNGMIHVIGTVTSVTDASISVKGSDGKTQTVALVAATKYLKGEKAITAKDIKAGDRVVIHATKKGEQLVAAEVKIGVAAGSMNGVTMPHPAASH